MDYTFLIRSISLINFLYIEIERNGTWFYFSFYSLFRLQLKEVQQEVLLISSILVFLIVTIRVATQWWHSVICIFLISFIFFLFFF